jgi:5-methyltetrahydropteroyltriglutamate--homocysteine methyltransferase
VAPCSMEITPNRYYKTQEEYLFAIADALSVEYRMIVDAGFILQVDDAILPMQRFMTFQGVEFAEYRKWATVRMEALNHALKGIPEDQVRYHICFGSQNVPHTTDPNLRDIIDLVLMANARAYSIEASNPRHEHEWQIWRDVKLPDGKILIPGVIGHATNIVEHPELIALRLKSFADLVGRENVIAGSDCGFSQSWNSPRVHVQVQWAKLESLVEGARLASKYLWKH